jgi:hypothetical protein
MAWNAREARQNEKARSVRERAQIIIDDEWI